MRRDGSRGWTNEPKPHSCPRSVNYGVHSPVVEKKGPVTVSETVSPKNIDSVTRLKNPPV